MLITFEPQWKLLIDCEMARKDLRVKAELSSATIAKLGKEVNVRTTVLAKICGVLDCQLSDIATEMPNKESENNDSLEEI